MKILFTFVFLMSGFYIQPSFATKNKKEQLGESLVKHAKNGNINTVEGLLKDGADINYFLGFENSLISASRVGDYNMVKFLLDKGADIKRGNVNIITKYMRTPLHASVRYGHFNIVKFLTERGASIPPKISKKYPDYYKRNILLHEAVKNKHLNIAKFLLDKGVDVNAKDKKGNTALYLIVKKEGKKGLLDKNAFEIARLLVSRKADVHTKNDLGLTPFKVATSYKRKKFLNFLKASGVK